MIRTVLLVPIVFFYKNMIRTVLLVSNWGRGIWWGIAPFSAPASEESRADIGNEPKFAHWIDKY